MTKSTLLSRAAAQAAAVPQFAGYQENTKRTIPVIVLKPEA